MFQPTVTKIDLRSFSETVFVLFTFPVTSSTRSTFPPLNLLNSLSLT